MNPEAADDLLAAAREHAEEVVLRRAIVGTFGRAARREHEEEQISGVIDHPRLAAVLKVLGALGAVDRAIEEAELLSLLRREHLEDGRHVDDGTAEAHLLEPAVVAARCRRAASSARREAHPS